MYTWPHKGNEAFKYVPIERLKSFEERNLFRGSIDSQSELKLAPGKAAFTQNPLTEQSTHHVDKVLETGTYLVQLSCPEEHSIHPAIDIKVPPSQEVVLVLYFANEHDKSWINLSLNAQVDSKASLTILSNVASDKESHYCVFGNIKCESHARVFWNHLVVKGAFSHFNVNTTLGHKAHGAFRSCILAAETSFHSFQPRITHASPSSSCDIQTRGLGFDKSILLQHGTIYVPEQSTQIQAHYSSDNLLLSDQAKVYARPDLDIHCDDVVCSHGVTFGSIDPEHVFYLQSRQLDEKAARLLLLKAFVFKLLDDYPPAVSLPENMHKAYTSVEQRLTTLLER